MLKISITIPVDVRTVGEVPFTSASHATTEEPVEGLVSEGQSQALAELAGAVDLLGRGYFRPKWGYPEGSVCQPAAGIL